MRVMCSIVLGRSALGMLLLSLVRRRLPPVNRSDKFF
jgi:hypothetical protein